MAERKRGRKKSDESAMKLSKEEDAIARYIRFTCPTKTTMFEGNEVHYFTGSKAVDTLLESKYGTMAKEPMFTSRSSVIAFMRTLMEKHLFFRARKLVSKKKEDKKKEKSNQGASKSPRKRNKKEELSEKEKENDDDKVKKKTGSDDKSEDEKDDEGEKKLGEKDDDDKKKRKIKLEVHDVQIFSDSSDVYVWIFDPTPLFKKVIGALMVLGTIAGCLFPLWPMWLRQAIYYLSLAGLALFGVLIGVAIARTILFCIIWAVTMGKHKLWILPNLTEDCGFFESFQPLYTYEYCPSGSTGKKKPKKGKSDEKKKSKDSDESDSAKPNNSKEESFSSEGVGDKKNDDSEVSDEESASDVNSDISVEESNGDFVQHKVRESKADLKRRARKADDDFVLLEKQRC
ncbi:hypothetical protein AB6A40_000692 [Gnathostoma spinigerum]|uniref:Translocation protein SEC62 n=1 Tax=Gnathostoma spinigerum TaxID=75299 RepID=A0ABD6E2P1_9BILA